MGMMVLNELIKDTKGQLKICLAMFSLGDSEDFYFSLGGWDLLVLAQMQSVHHLLRLEDSRFETLLRSVAANFPLRDPKKEIAIKQAIQFFQNFQLNICQPLEVV